MHNVGQWYRETESGELFILACIGCQENLAEKKVRFAVALISLQDGMRWNKPVWTPTDKDIPARYWRHISDEGNFTPI